MKEMRTFTTVSLALAAALMGGCQTFSSDEAQSVASLNGATFTTLADGSRVNANIYASKSDVYLDGGPGDQAPSGAAALPAGDYYFQVTDPSGKYLLSTDAITARQFTVDENGLIVAVFSHVSGVDADHGALTVQLMPYLDTPNNGGEYKVWLTPVDEYIGVDGRGVSHGFVPRYSKTDNFKVREVVVAPYCGDGTLDAGEYCDDGNTTNGDGCSATCTIEPPPPPPHCCGDGTLDAGEQCDDGNTSSGDGCSATCQTEVDECD
jgi:cysteine-rich repeat protein